MPNEIFAGSWPKSTDSADEIATALDTRPKFVASRTLDEVKWSNSILLKGHVAEEVAKLKAQEGGEIQVHGSADLLQTLLKHDLIDMLRIWQFPANLNSGLSAASHYRGRGFLSGRRYLSRRRFGSGGRFVGGGLLLGGSLQACLDLFG